MILLFEQIRILFLFGMKETGWGQMVPSHWENTHLDNLK